MLVLYRGREHEKSIVIFTLALPDMLHLTDQLRYSEVVKLELQLQDQLPNVKALTLRSTLEYSIVLWLI